MALDMHRQRSRVAALVSLAFLLTQISGSIMPPALPRAAHYFSVDPQSVKYFIAIFFFGYAIGQMIWGTLSDSYGRRRMLRLATLMYLICIALAAQWHWIVVFYFNYALVGFAAASYTSVGNALLKDIYPKDQLSKVIAFIGVVMGLGPFLGAALGTNLIAFGGWRSLFVFLFLWAFAVLLGLWRLIPETHQAVVTEFGVPWHQRFKFVLRNRRFQRSIAVLALSFAAFTSYLTVASFLFIRVIHLSAYWSGWLMALPALSYVLGALTVMLCVKNYGPWRLIRMSVGCFVVVLLVFWVAQLLFAKPVLLVLLLVMLMYVLGMLVPLGKSGCMTALSQYGGSTASLMKFIQSTTTVIFSYAIAHFSGYSFVPILVLFSVVALGMLAVVLLLNDE